MVVTKQATDVVYRGYDIRWSDARQAYEVWAEGRLCGGGGAGWNNIEQAEAAIDFRRRSRVAAGLGAVG